MTQQRVLSKSEIAEIVSKGSSDPAQRAWPTTKDKELLLKAVEAKAKLVTFTDGTIFKIRYSDGVQYKFGKDDERHSTIFVSRMDGVVAPCGWFSEGSLRKDLFK
jgi:hypothetical protein